MDPKQTNRPEEGRDTALDDERRVRVLSPGALVAKRFFRNRLAVAGVVILAAMFLFAFVGGLVSPYGESQVFEGVEQMHKEYASVLRNSDYRYVETEQGNFPSAARSAFLLARGRGDESFTAGRDTYYWQQEGEELCTISLAVPVAEVALLRGSYTYTDLGTGVLIGEVKAAFEAAAAAEEELFSVGDSLYLISGTRKFSTIHALQPLALATKTVIEPVSGQTLDYELCRAALLAREAGLDSFSSGGQRYRLETEGTGGQIVLDGQPVAVFSPYLVRAADSGETLSPTLKNAILEAVAQGQSQLIFPLEDGEETLTIEEKNGQFTVRRDTVTKVIKVYEPPSREHWLGTDANGMDILTRLMYGGRISLIIGFVVILIELIIGVTLGGVAGYFGGALDNLIMRLVDIFNCIPTWPILIIIGSIMDAQQTDPALRIYMMMLVLGVLGWPGVARMVRGQILSLREQEFMIAAEAAGLSVSRRIFRHLIPNVIPQLIVICTMGLGNIILTESTMSFLGLGVKFPFASWGNIIQSVSNVYVMTNYWFIWIPAGFLILATVLGFNFVGDGLRDAFDPKMKR